jgi:hypothetical protein
VGEAGSPSHSALERILHCELKDSLVWSACFLVSKPQFDGTEGVAVYVW